MGEEGAAKSQVGIYVRIDVNGDPPVVIEHREEYRSSDGTVPEEVA